MSATHSWLMPVSFIRLARFRYTSNSWSESVVTTKPAAGRQQVVLTHQPRHALWFTGSRDGRSSAVTRRYP